MADPENIGTFERVFSFEYESVPVVLYRCKETGLRVASAQVKSPTVHGYFTVQTEAFDDYGCPHTLEHLIFLGSENYPYKGVLDVLANRCFAQGTNAWTDTDHTCYTVDTAGSEGFLRILPVYLDHVLFPTLKDSGFVTEVHHVTGEGANAGVVYCEMQARENEAYDIVDRAMKLAAYPGVCSYKSETGGRLKELRELTNETIRAYHKSYYRPDNLCVIVSGQVSPAELCAACAPVVESIKQSEEIRKLPKLVRPFSSPVPKPSEPVKTVIEFPAEDEKTGAICELAWHGPKWDDLTTIMALQVLLAYLTQDSISPLRKALVETVPAFCGKVGHSMIEQCVYLFHITLKSVDVEQLSKRDVDEEISAVLRSLVADGGAAIDLPRMRSLIGQQRRQHLSAVEGDPHELFSGELIGAFLYAPDFAPGGCPAGVKPGAALQARLDQPKALEPLLEWTAPQWAALMEGWLLGQSGGPRISVVGMPSKSCGERIQKADLDRIAEQKKQMGEEGCSKAGKEVEAAEDENDVETPDEVAESFALPDVSKISLISVSTVIVEGPSKAFKEVYGQDAAKVRGLLEGAGAAGLPAPTIQFDHVAGAQFVQCHVMLPTAGLTVKQLELLPLWRDVLFELPLSESANGPAMSYEAVVQELTDSTVLYSSSVGVGGGRFSVGEAGNMLHVAIKVERSRYADAARLIARVLADATFDVERLRAAATRMLNDVPNSKRNAKGLMSLAMLAMKYRDDCSHGAFNVFRVEKNLQALLKAKGGLEKAAKELEAIRKKLLASASAIFVRVAGDVEQMSGDSFAPWLRAPFVAAENAKPAKTVKPVLARELFAKDKMQPKRGKTAGCILSSSAEESNYWRVQCDSFTNPRSPELASLLVAIEYVTALEGPFWRKIRGKGLSYSYSLSHNLSTGAITFGLFKATDPLAAFEQAGLIVRGLCEEVPAGDEKESTPGKGEGAAPEGKEEGNEEGKEEDEEGSEEGSEDDEDDGLDPAALEAAQSGVLFGLIEPVDTVPSAMDEAFEKTIRREPPDQLEWLMKEVQAVTEESVRAALKKHVLPLFTGSKGRTVSLVCPEAKAKKTKAGLLKLKPPFKVAHFNVEALVKAVAPANGFEAFREKCGGAAADGAKPGERRTDPADGMAYTLPELEAHYGKEGYLRKAILKYWEEECKAARGKAAGKGGKAAGPTEAGEIRVDPADGKAYMLDELVAFYADYKKKAVEVYFEKECTPAKGAAKGKAKAKAKGKAKSKAKAKLRPKA